MRVVREILSLPELRTRPLVQRQDRPLLAAGGADELIAIDQDGFAEAPRRPAIRMTTAARRRRRG